MIDRGLRALSTSRMMHGGWTDSMPLDAERLRAFDALVDTLIPAEDGWPDSSALAIAALAVRYLVPDTEELSLYPHFRRSEFEQLLDSHVGPIVGLPLNERVARLVDLESSDPALFARLRDFVYYIYYGSGSVVAQIRQRTTYGADFHGAPQPEGASATIEGWGDRTLTTKGTFIPTDLVTRSLRGGTHVR